jgi:hypothetical protein
VDVSDAIGDQCLQALPHELLSPVADAAKTMALVEACYRSSATGGTPIEAV